MRERKFEGGKCNQQGPFHFYNCTLCPYLFCTFLLIFTTVGVSLKKLLGSLIKNQRDQQGEETSPRKNQMLRRWRKFICFAACFAMCCHLFFQMIMKEFSCPLIVMTFKFSRCCGFLFLSSFLDTFAFFSSYFLHEFLLSMKVVEVKSSGIVSTRKIHRRHLLKSSGEYLLFFIWAKFQFFPFLFAYV